MNFADKTVVITGGSKGFGKGLAEAFLKEKAHVIITSDNEGELKAVSDELRCEFFTADASSFDDNAALVKFVLEKHTKIDVWINNAGIQIAPSNLEDVDTFKLNRLFAVNFFGYFYGCKAVLPVMKQADSGVIINVNSTAGLGGKPGLSAYVPSKFAIRGMTESLREELRMTGIKVYQVFPGGMKTGIYHEKIPQDFNDYMDIRHAIDKIMDNLKSDEPELDLVIRRPAS